MRLKYSNVFVYFFKKRIQNGDGSDTCFSVGVSNPVSELNWYTTILLLSWLLSTIQCDDGSNEKLRGITPKVGVCDIKISLPVMASTEKVVTLLCPRLVQWRNFPLGDSLISALLLNSVKLGGKEDML